MTIKTIRTEDFLGKPANFEIIWETVYLTCTFAVGVQTDKRNKLSIFHVTSMGGKDIYTCLDTYYLNLYDKKYNVSIEEKIKKQMKKVITEILTARVKVGILTIEQIERWVKK